MPSASPVEAAARHGIPVQDLAIRSLVESEAENERLRKLVREARQHLERGRTGCALRALDGIDD